MYVKPHPYSGFAESVINLPYWIRTSSSELRIRILQFKIPEEFQKIFTFHIKNLKLFDNRSFQWPKKRQSKTRIRLYP
jgi:hypothetical protein